MAKTTRRYFHFDGPESGITPAALKRLGRKKQIDYMVDWFQGQYEDPANETPYESREGGYQYIWGGPYDAKEELFDEFGDLIREDRIDSAVEIVQSDGTYEWAPGPNHPRQQERRDEAFEEERPVPSDDEPAPDLASTIEHLANGGATRIGTQEERTFRSAAITHLDRLSDALASQRAPTGLGHNNPPPDEDEAVTESVIKSVSDDATLIRTELKQDNPNALQVAEATSRLKALWGWLAKKADSAADGFVKAMGAALAVPVAATLIPAVQPILRDAIKAVGEWLTTITLPF